MADWLGLGGDIGVLLLEFRPKQRMGTARGAAIHASGSVVSCSPSGGFYAIKIVRSPI